MLPVLSLLTTSWVLSHFLCEDETPRVCVCGGGQWIIGFCAEMTVWELSKRRRREEREGEKRKNFRGEEKPQDTHGAISSLSLFLLSFPLSHTHICTHSQSVPADHLQRSYDWKRGRVILYSFAICNGECVYVCGCVCVNKIQQNNNRNENKYNVLL